MPWAGPSDISSTQVNGRTSKRNLSGDPRQVNPRSEAGARRTAGVLRYDLRCIKEHCHYGTSSLA